MTIWFLINESKTVGIILLVLLVIVVINNFAKFLENIVKLVTNLKIIIIWLLKAIKFIILMIIKIIFFPITIYKVIKRYKYNESLIINNSQLKEVDDD